MALEGPFSPLHHRACYRSGLTGTDWPRKRFDRDLEVLGVVFAPVGDRLAVQPRAFKFSVQSDRSVCSYVIVAS